MLKTKVRFGGVWNGLLVNFLFNLFLVIPRNSYLSCLLMSELGWGRAKVLRVGSIQNYWTISENINTTLDLEHFPLGDVLN